MAGRPPYGQPQQPPRNPFSNTPSPAPYAQPTRQYSTDSLGSEAYGSRNGSSVPLTDPQGGYYNQPGRYSSQCEF